MKTIDIKSLLIGVLLTSTIILGIAASTRIGGDNLAGPIKVELTVKNNGEASFKVSDK